MTAAQHLPGLASRVWDDDAYDREFDEATGAFKDKIPHGAFDIEVNEKTGQRWFWFRCPGQCGGIAPIALRPVSEPNVAQSWEFDGNLVAPTLRPSINHVGCWHGWLTNGEFTSC